jgi:hypothetical protein
VAIDSKGSANAGSANSIRVTVRTRLSRDSLMQHVAAIGGFKASLETEIKEGAAAKQGVESDSPKCVAAPTAVLQGWG